jgi:hypothetical protein
MLPSDVRMGRRTIDVGLLGVHDVQINSAIGVGVSASLSIFDFLYPELRHYSLEGSSNGS